MQGSAAPSIWRAAHLCLKLGCYRWQVSAPVELKSISVPLYTLLTNAVLAIIDIRCTFPRHKSYSSPRPNLLTIPWPISIFLGRALSMSVVNFFIIIHPSFCFFQTKTIVRDHRAAHIPWIRAHSPVTGNWSCSCYRGEHIPSGHFWADVQS